MSNLQNHRSDGFWANLALIALFLLLALAPNGAKAQYLPVAWYDFDSNHWENGAGTGLDFIAGVDSMWVGIDDPVRDSFLQVNTLQWPPVAQPADSGRAFTELTVEFWFRADKPFAGLSVARLTGKCHFELYDQYVAWDVVTYPGQHWRLELLLYGAGVTDPHHLWDGQWHHFAGTFDVKTGTQRLYIDGRNEAGMTRHNGTASAMGQSFAFIPYQSMVDSVGDLDEIAVYDTVLPPDLIWQHYFNGLQGQAYAFNVNPGGPFAPVPQNVAQGGIDTLEFCPGYPSTPVASPDLLKGYPAPRYRPGHAMPRLLPWFNDTYNIANNSGVTPFSAGGPPMDTLLRRLATDYNYYLHLGGAREYLNVGPFSQAQFYIQSGNLPINAGLPRFVVLNWAQTNPEEYQPAWGAGCYIKRQTLPNHFYARPLAGAPFVNGIGSKIWSWQAAQNPLDTRLDTLDRDGLTARYYLSLVNTVIPHPIAMIGENDEAVGSMPNGWVSLPNGDPWMFQDRSLSFPGLSPEGYQSRRGRDFRRRYSDRFVHYQNAQPWQLDSVQLYWYNVGGDAGISFFQYDSARAINRFADGVPRGTDYWYPQFPARWRYGTGPVTGFRELLPGRLAEILAGDRRFMPGVSPGFHEQGSVWISTDRGMLRPGQFLGCLKALGMMGADGYAMFMTHGISTSLVPMEGSWRAWQPAMPAYAQAVTDRMGNLLSGGYLLDGDQAMGPGSLFMFATGNPMDLVCARRADNAARYALHGSIQRLDNAPSHGPKEKEVCFSLADSAGVVIDTVLMDIRAQGSTYILDMSTADTVFYQLDGWHEWMEPWRWCRDFVLEGELADSVGNGPGVVATERPAGHAAGDFREFTSWMRVGNGQTLLYRFTTRHAEQDTLHLWMRARRTQPGANNDVDVFLDGIYRGTVPVAATTWGWSAVPVVLPGLGQRDHDLRLLSNHNGIEIDKVLLARSADPFVGQVFLPEALVEDSVVCLDDSALFHVGGKVPAGCLEYRWDFGDGNFAYSADPAHLYGFAGVYEVVLEVRHTCLDSVAWDTVTVVVDAPQVEAGRDTFMCVGDTMRLAGAGSYFFKWREDSLVSSPIVPDPLAWPLESGYLHLDGWDPLTGCHAVDSLHITLLGPQPVGDTVIWYCDGQGIVEVEVPQGQGQYWVWWAADSLLDSVDRWDSHVAYVIEDSGHVFTAYVSDFCRCDTDTVRVRILPVGLPVAAIASHDTICEGDTLWLHAQGTVSGQGLPDWWGLFGYNANGGIRTTATGVTVWALPPALGDATVPITLQYIVSGSTCGTLGRVRDTVEVVLLGRPNVQGVPDTLWACPGGLMPQLSPVNGHPAPVSWDWQPAAGFSNPAVPSSTFTGSPGIPVACSLTVNTAWGCPVTYHSVLMPMGILPDSLYQCPGDSVGVGVSAGVQPGMAINVQWSPPQWFSPANAPVTTLGVPGLSPQVVTVQYDYFGCPTMHDTLLVVPHGLPEVLGPDTIRGCAGDTLPLVATLANPVQWGLSGLSVGDSTSPVTWTVAQGQPFTLYVASCDSFFCPGFDSVLVTWLDVIPGPDTVRACLNDTIVLPGIGGGTCSWSPMTDVLSTNNCTLVALPQMDRWYRLAWTDSTGCVAYDSVWVDVDSVSLTGALVSVDDSICLGDSVQLVASGGTVYQWTPSMGLSNAAVGSPWASPLVTTTYTVAVSNGGACVVEDSLTVTVDTTVPLGWATQTDDTVCVNGPVTLTAGGGAGYHWEWPVGNFSTAPSITVAPGITTDFIVRVSDGGVCEWRDTARVAVDQGCCWIPGVDTMFHRATMTDIIAWNGGSGFVNGRHLYIRDTLWVDTLATFSQCILEMGKHAKVVVMPGVQLQSANCHFRSACGDTVWEGLDVLGPTGRYISKRDTIEQANIGLTSISGAYIELSDDLFRQSRIHVQVRRWDNPHPARIMSNVFDGGQIPRPFQSMVAPEAGVDLQEVRLIEIGVVLPGSQPNVFNRLQWGVRARNGVTILRNNAFKNMVTTLGPGEPGTAVHATFVTLPGYSMIRGLVVGDTTYGGAPDYWARNTFSTCRSGVWVRGNFQVQAYGNEFNEVSSRGISITGPMSRLVRLEGNRMQDCQLGIALNNARPPFPASRIYKNVLSQTSIDSLKGIRLDMVTHPLLVNNDSAWGLQVEGNRIALRGECLWLQGCDHVEVASNNIFMSGGTGATVDRSVFIAGGGNNRLYDNETQSVYGGQASDTLFSGLFVAASPETDMECNRVLGFGRAIVWENQCQPSRMYANELGRSWDGLVLQNQGEIGDQGFYQASPLIEVPSDNVWQNGVAGFGRFQTLALEAIGNQSRFYARRSPNYNPPNNSAFGAGSSPVPFDSTMGPKVTAYLCRRSASTDPKGDAVRDIATNRLITGEHSAESQYLADKWAFTELLKDSTLMTTDTLLTRYHDSLATTNLGKMAAAELSIASGDTAAAVMAMASVFAPSTYEAGEAWAILKRMALEEEFTGFTSMELAYLQSKAAECPRFGGNAVYTCRSLLAMEEDYLWPDDHCAGPANKEGSAPPVEVTPPPMASLWPNPSTSGFTVQVLDAAKRPWHLRVSHVSGRSVWESHVEGGHAARVSTAGFPAGVYLVEAALGDGSIWHSRVVVVH